MNDVIKKFKAVLFDLDGTLLNTLDDIANSMNTALREQGFPDHDIDTYRYLVGKGITALAEAAVPQEYRNTKTISAVEKRMREIYAVHWAAQTHLYPGVSGLLDELTHRKISINILSNKPDEYTAITVKKFLSRWRFGIIMGSKDSIPRKPAPDGALFIAEALGIDCSDFVYLGDTDVDMETACAAGMYPAGALWGFRTKEELVSNGALSVFEDPCDLLELFPQ